MVEIFNLCVLNKLFLYINPALKILYNKFLKIVQLFSDNNIIAFILYYI